MSRTSKIINYDSTTIMTQTWCWRLFGCFVLDDFRLPWSGVPPLMWQQTTSTCMTLPPSSIHIPPPFICHFNPHPQCTMSCHSLLYSLVIILPYPLAIIALSWPNWENTSVGWVSILSLGIIQASQCEPFRLSFSVIPYPKPWSLVLTDPENRMVEKFKMLRPGWGQTSYPGQVLKCPDPPNTGWN
jgi:hypothetical protein